MEVPASRLAFIVSNLPLDIIIYKNFILCDGGRTFTELARALKDRGAGRIGLFVTHGIFSRGLDPLFAEGIDDIFTTDSFYQSDDRAEIVHKFFPTEEDMKFLHHI